MNRNQRVSRWLARFLWDTVMLRCITVMVTPRAPLLVRCKGCHHAPLGYRCRDVTGLRCSRVLWNEYLSGKNTPANQLMFVNPKWLDCDKDIGILFLDNPKKPPWSRMLLGKYGIYAW